MKKILNMAWVLNMAKFRIWQGCQYAIVSQRSEYARICLDRFLNIFWVPIMPGFRIGQGSEYARVTQCSKYATTLLSLSEQDVNMSEYV